MGKSKLADGVSALPHSSDMRADSVTSITAPTARRAPESRSGPVGFIKGCATSSSGEVRGRAWGGRLKGSALGQRRSYDGQPPDGDSEAEGYGGGGRVRCFGVFPRRLA